MNEYDGRCLLLHPPDGLYARLKGKFLQEMSINRLDHRRPLMCLWDGRLVRMRSLLPCWCNAEESESCTADLRYAWKATVMTGACRGGVAGRNKKLHRIM